MIQPEIEAKVLEFLDDAIAMELKLTEDENDYSLHFVREKLAKCGTYLERLSDLQMKLTKLSIDVTKKQAAVQGLYHSRLIEVRGSEVYRNAPRHAKADLLTEGCLGAHVECESWMALKRMVSEVKEAIGDRAQTMKRLDSDLRLHSKLLEMVPHEGRGATHPSSYTGPRQTGRDDEIDL